jgi:hypothetical protein
VQGLRPVSTEEKDAPFDIELAFKIVADGQQRDNPAGHDASLRLPAQDSSARGSCNHCLKGRSDKHHRPHVGLE